MNEQLREGVLPLAPISNVTKSELPHVIQEMKTIIERIPDPGKRAKLWTEAYLLMGLKYTIEETEEYLKGVHGMKESVTYQAIHEEGKLEGVLEGRLVEAREIISRIGERRFGPISKANEARLNAITDVPKLNTLVNRLMDVETWSEFLFDV